MFGNMINRVTGNNVQNPTDTPAVDPTQTSTPQATPDPNLSDQNNKKDSFDPNINIWDNPTSDDSTKPSGDKPGDKKSLSQTLDEYVSGLNFAPEINASHFEVGEEGGQLPITQVLNETMKGMYRQMLGDLTQMMQAHGTKLQNDVMAQMDSTFNTRDAVASLEAAIPSANDPNIRPVAQAVKAAFLRNGNSDADANEMTRQFLQHATQKLSGDLNLDVAPAGSPGSGGFNNNRPHAEDINWVEVLSQKPSG